jgi:hypothetical protein
MRVIFGLVGLVVVLAIVATLAKKQLGAVSDIKVPQPAGATAPVADPNANVRQQSQQIQQQVKKSVEDAMQQARPMPDDK